MSSLAAKFANQFTTSARSTSALLSGVQRSSKLCYSTGSPDGDNDGAKNGGADDFHDDFIPEKRESIPQGVDPKRGWNFRGVHGGLWDHRVMGAKDWPKPAMASSSVYVEGDIEIRVYNRGITGEVVRMPEICVRTDGKVRLIKPGESTTNIPFEELPVSEI
uniref:Uncharacterized protein n=1 Tax=Chenopodium quinoa TaxID=63459 RepID=A0A803KNW2_CHEQI